MPGLFCFAQIDHQAKQILFINGSVAVHVTGKRMIRIDDIPDHQIRHRYKSLMTFMQINTGNSGNSRYKHGYSKRRNQLRSISHKN